MSFRLAQELDQLADELRGEAESCGIDEARAARLKLYLHAFSDVRALEAWIYGRVAQEIGQRAEKERGRASEDVTVLERGPRR